LSIEYALGTSGLFVLALLALLLRLHDNIRVVLNNYVSGLTGQDRDWVTLMQRATAGAFLALLLAAASGSGFLDLELYPDGLLGWLALPVIALWGGCIVLLVYENYDMYWKLTFRHLAANPLTWLSSLAVALVVWLRFSALPVSGNPGWALVVMTILTGGQFLTLLLCLGLAIVVRRPGWDAQPPRSPDYFEDKATGIYHVADRRDEAFTPPDAIVKLDLDYGGDWIVAGDLDGDGVAELVSARNHLHHDDHYTASVSAQKLDGTILWLWGDPAFSRRSRSYDVACQIHDWNGDGRNEVILATKGWLVELEGSTGRELRRFPIPRHASDMLMFADLRGSGRPTDVMVKDRYHKLHAFNMLGQPLFSVRDPGGFMLAHRPLALDLDGDGREEILAGFAMLNPDGAIRWTYRSSRVKLWFGGHQDSACVYRLDQAHPENTRLLITFCDGSGMAMLDGNGRCIWELGGRHFATVAVGRLLPGVESRQIIVDLGHLQRNAPGEVWILDEAGTLLATLRGGDRAFPIDWNGDGIDELVFAPPPAVGEAGEKLSLFAMAPDFYRFRAGDLYGRGVLDAMMIGGGRLALYSNQGARLTGSDRPCSPGTCLNTSSYAAPVHSISSRLLTILPEA